MLAALACVRAKLWTYGSDTGTFAQIVHDAFGGMRNGVEGGSHYRYHWSPSLALLWPLVALTRSALPLQIAQAAATVACAPLVCALARRYTGGRLAIRLAYVTLLYPPLLALGFDEFHELGFFTALVLGMFVAIDEGRWIWFGLCAALVLGLREDAAATLIAFGAVLFAIGVRPSQRGAGLLDDAPRNPKAVSAAGALTVLCSIGVLLLYYLAIVPRFGGWGPSHFYVYPFANGPLALVLSPLTHPIAFVLAIVTPGRLTYVLEALAPLVFLPLRARWTLLALPGAAVVLLANSGYVWRMGDHYAALWIPWLLVGAIAAVARLARARGESSALNWTTASSAVCMFFLIAFDPMHPLHYLHSYYHDLADARRAIACVPANASMSTYDEWFSAIAAQRPLATIDLTGGVAYLVYADDFPSVSYQFGIRPVVAAKVAIGKYRTICRFGEVTTYQRVRH